MGASGGITTPTVPSVFQIAVPTLPLIALGGTYNATVQWPDAFPHDGWQFTLDQRELLGKAVAAISNPTPAAFTLTVTASLLLSVGAQVYILGWA